MTESAFGWNVHISGHCPIQGGPGTWLALIINGQEQAGSDTQILGASKLKTSQEQLDIRAAIAALAVIREKPQNGPVAIWTAGSYLKRVMTDWRFTWANNDWKLSNGHSVKDRARIETLIAAADGLEIHWLCVEHGDHLPETSLEDDLIG